MNCKENSIYCSDKTPKNYVYRIEADKDTQEPTATKELLEECKKVSEKYQEFKPEHQKKDRGVRKSLS